MPMPRTSLLSAAFILSELIFHTAVRLVRKGSGNAIIALATNIAQTLLFVVTIYAVFLVMGWGPRGLRGDLLLYVLTGVFIYICHVKAMQAILQAEGPTSPMMKHAPMNTYVSIGAAALSALYLQLISIVALLLFYHAVWTPVLVHDLLGSILMLLLTWGSGVAVGIGFLALKPWFPNFVPLLAQVYSRLNIFASGKMFVANALPAFLLPYFIWNPLFHIVDQARGFVFLNYVPHKTSLLYPVIFTAAALVLGLMGEAYTRRYASLSWAQRK